MFRIHAPALILSSLMTVTAAAETSNGDTIVVVIARSTLWRWLEKSTRDKDQGRFVNEEMHIT